MDEQPYFEFLRPSAVTDNHLAKCNKDYHVIMHAIVRDDWWFHYVHRMTFPPRQGLMGSTFNIAHLSKK
jgi:hypothetical protein